MNESGRGGPGVVAVLYCILGAFKTRAECHGRGGLHSTVSCTQTICTPLYQFKYILDAYTHCNSKQVLITRSLSHVLS
jgi:hypothetical protein